MRFLAKYVREDMRRAVLLQCELLDCLHANKMTKLMHNALLTFSQQSNNLDLSFDVFVLEDLKARHLLADSYNTTTARVEHDDIFANSVIEHSEWLFTLALRLIDRERHDPFVFGIDADVLDGRCGLRAEINKTRKPQR